MQVVAICRYKIKLTIHKPGENPQERRPNSTSLSKIIANKYDFKRLQRTILKFRSPYIYYIILAELKLTKNDKAKAKIADRHYETTPKIMSRQISYGRNAN